MAASAWSTHPSIFGCERVSFNALLQGDPGAIQTLRASMRDTGAVFLSIGQFNQKLSKALDGCHILARSGLLVSNPLPAAVRVLPGRERRLEYSLHNNFAGALARSEVTLERTYRKLSGMGRAILHALDVDANHAPLAELMEAAKVKEYDVGCSLLSISRLPAGRGHALGAAVGRTDGGLLTLIHSHAPGLEVRTGSRGSDPATTTWCEVEDEAFQRVTNTVVVLVGETLAAASGGAYPAAIYRVVAKSDLRCAVTLQLRAAPGAALPGAPGDTVAGITTQFRMPPKIGDLTASGALVEVCSSDTAPDSVADFVFQTPQLAALIAASFTMDLVDDGAALARASLLCRGSATPLDATGRCCASDCTTTTLAA